jgi:uncharacterized protein YodC (DUF2158 family)
MKQFSSVFLILIYTLTFSNISFGKSLESAEEIAKKPFEILYFETLPEASFQALESHSTDQSSKASHWAWSFEAFGKQFQLSLDPNTRLIAKISSEKRERLKENLTFYRGRLEGYPSSWVRLTRVEQQWSGMIWDGQEAYIIDSLSVITPALQTVPAETSAELAIYRISDTRDLGTQTCGLGESEEVPLHPMTRFDALIEELQDQVGVTAQGATRNIDMTVVTDQEFNSINSNPDAAVIARMNIVDGIFSEQLGVQISLVDVLPLQNNGGLSSTNAGTLINQFGEFTASESFDHPGVAHLFSGRNLDGSTVGIAYLSSLCSARFGVGVNQILGTGTAGALTVAHELGHNFGAPHDNQSGSPCASTQGSFLMNPFLNGSDQFSPCSVSQIQPVISGASCITLINVETFPPPIATPAPGSSLTTSSVTFTGGHTSQDTEHWLYVGTSVGANNLHDSGSMGTGHTRTVTGLPTSGTIHVRWYTKNSSGSWLRQDHTYTMNADGGGGAFPPPMATPAPGSTLTSTTVDFTGGHTSQDAAHWLYVGTSVGANNLHDSGSMGTGHTRTVTGLPTSGTIHVRWYTKNSSGSWLRQDHTYTMNADGGN